MRRQDQNEDLKIGEVARPQSKVIDPFTRKFFLALLLCSIPFPLAAQSPSLRKISPWSVVPGQTTEIEITGDHLDTVSNAWFSFRAQVTFTNRSEEKISCLVTVPTDVPVGPAALRLSNEGGVSSLQMIMIDDLPPGFASETNISFLAAQELMLPLAVDGNAHEAKPDYYKFQARKDQRLSIEVVAQRLGSQLDSVVRLLDARGRELLYCEDDPGVGADSRFSYLFSATGDYFLELHDIGFQGGSQYRYHLRLGEFPLVTVPFPLAIQAADRKPLVELAGPSVDGLGAFQFSSGIGARRQMSSVQFAKGGPSGFFAIGTSDFATVAETEPNNEPAQANQVPLPVTINGRFDQPRDRDFFQFEAAQGQKLVFQARTRGAGSPCDVYMKLIEEKGSEIAEVNLSSTNEGAITNTFKEAGRYRLLVEELNRRGGPGMNYRIDIFPLKPGAALSTDTDRLQIAPGEAGRLKITAARFEYDGPITILLEGADADLTLEKNVIPEKKNEVEIEIKASSQLIPGQILMLKLRGQATNSTEKLPVSTVPALQKLFPLMTYPPPEFDELIAIGIRK